MLPRHASRGNRHDRQQESFQAGCDGATGAAQRSAPSPSPASEPAINGGRRRHQQRDLGESSGSWPYTDGALSPWWAATLLVPAHDTSVLIYSRRGEAIFPPGLRDSGVPVCRVIPLTTRSCFLRKRRVWENIRPSRSDSRCSTIPNGLLMMSGSVEPIRTNQRPRTLPNIANQEQRGSDRRLSLRHSSLSLPSGHRRNQSGQESHGTKD